MAQHQAGDPHPGVPSLPRALVPRRRLEGRLADAERRRITLVSGLPGAGKTTLVASWLRSYGRPVAWVRVDGRHDEPGRLARAVLSALVDLADAVDARLAPGAVAAIEELDAKGFAVLAVNAKDRASVAALAPWLQPGRTVVLVGSSGAGKSTLTNSLLGTERMKTAQVRPSDEKGRHTTTHRALVPLPSGACLIDTPGMRELKPTGEEDVAENFSDVEAVAEQCRFRDCSHDREPGCAVRRAIEDGTLDAQRYANYVKLGVEVAGAAHKLAVRQSENAPGKPAGKPAGNKSASRRDDDRNGRH